MSGFFITAAGTDVGKTFVACGLIKALPGRAVAALKPVVSGFDPAQMQASDPGRLLKALRRPVTLAEIESISPWRFTAPLSPDMAAAREQRTVDFDALVSFSAKTSGSSMLLVEGVGGVMVPLDESHTTLDWMGALGFPVILVGGSYLGAISHTLSAFDVLGHRGLIVAALVVSESEGSPVPLRETVATLGRFTSPVAPLALPRDPAHHDAAFAALAVGSD